MYCALECIQGENIFLSSWYMQLMTNTYSPEINPNQRKPVSPRLLGNSVNFEVWSAINISTCTHLCKS